MDRLCASDGNEGLDRIGGIKFQIQKETMKNRWITAASAAIVLLIAAVRIEEPDEIAQPSLEI
ncbi:MAG: hypothetical protein O3B13_20475 [Planctomycetota bacterium]|nr:hypothetical protein [Planctomycetota bacterium]MDA1165480.1 hypothetical protein [Planctomycetota bacterium]